MKKIIISCLVCLVAVVGLCFSGKNANAQAFLPPDYDIGYSPFIPITNFSTTIVGLVENYVQIPDYSYQMYNTSLGNQLNYSNVIRFEYTDNVSYRSEEFLLNTNTSHIWSNGLATVNNGYEFLTSTENLPLVFDIYGSNFLLPVKNSSFTNFGFSVIGDSPTDLMKFTYSITIDYMYVEKGLNTSISNRDVYTYSGLVGDGGYFGIDFFDDFISRYVDSPVDYVYIFNYDIFINPEDTSLNGSPITTFELTRSFYPDSFIDFNEDTFVEWFNSYLITSESPDFSSWIVNAVSGFLDTDIIGTFSISDILMFILAIGLVIMIIKFFMGG